MFQPCFLADLPRKLPAMRGGVFKPSLEGGLPLLELFLPSCRRKSATSWRNAAFLSPQNLNLAPQRANQFANLGARIIHTLTHVSPPHVPKNRTPAVIFRETVAHETHPCLGVTVKGVEEIGKR